MRGRGTDSEATIRERIQNAEEEMKAAESFDHIVVNDSLEHAYARLKSLLETQYQLVSRNA